VGIDALLFCYTPKQRRELAALDRAERAPEPAAVFARRSRRVLESFVAARCEIERVAAPIGRVAATFDEPVGLEIVDKKHHRVRTHPERPAQCLLGLTLGGDQSTQHADVTRLEPQRGERLLELGGDVKAQLHQE
jgi:hypothetical protein